MRSKIRLQNWLRASARVRVRVRVRDRIRIRDEGCGEVVVRVRVY